MADDIVITGEGDREEEAITIVDFVSSKGKRSWVWEYCGFPKENGQVDKTKSICKLCHRAGETVKMPFTGNTSTMAYHLNQKHYSEVHESRGSGPLAKKKKGRPMCNCIITVI